MRLSERDFQTFRGWAVQHFSKESSLTSRHIQEYLAKENSALSKRIGKAAKKVGTSAYIGRYLLSEVRKEGWLETLNGVWKVKITPERCAHCLKPMGEVYLIDSDRNRFCSDDCYEEFERYDDDYDCYYDEYMELFSEFKDVYPKLVYFRKLECEKDNINPLTHLSLIRLMKNFENIIWNSDYEDTIKDNGADGPIAGEIYRMIKILETGLQELQKTEINMSRNRPKQKTIYTVKLDTSFFTGPGKDSEVFKRFKKKAARYRMKNSNTWATTKLQKRSDWFAELKQVAGSALNYENLIKCPVCSSLREEKYTRRAVDGYRYCEKCCDAVEREGGFDDGGDYFYD